MNKKETMRILYSELVHAFPNCPNTFLHKRAELMVATLEEVDHTPPMRTATYATTTLDHSGRVLTTAICDDGTIWTKGWDGLWHKLPPIPQV
jgi:hypothetical protein